MTTSARLHARWAASALLGLALLGVGATAAVAADPTPSDSAAATSASTAGEVNPEMLVTTAAPPGLKASQEKPIGEKLLIGGLMGTGVLAFLFSAVAMNRKQNEVLLKGVNSELEWRRDRGMI